ncbi:MAG: amidase [Acidimicrobiales bacterium]
MTELHWLSAIELSRTLASGQVSSVEAVDHFAARIEALNGPTNAVVLTDFERARGEAKVIDDSRAKGEPLGPLAGVPMTVKDSFSTEGMVTTSGSPTLADHVPSEDAWPVAAVRAAGAVVMGKTNLPIWAGDLQSYNEVYGTTNNPYDLGRTPGGSSGGSAAALACGFTPLEIGSDIGGSIRIPSHMSGVVGHKPSYGIVPAHGQIPGPPGTLTLADLAVAGPMARTVEDLELGLELMAGPNRWDGPAWRLELPPARGGDSIAGFRIAAWLDDPHCPIDGESKSILEGAVAKIEAAGATVADDTRPDFTLEKVATTFHALLQAALAGGETRDRIEEFALETGTGFTADARRSLAMRHREWLSNNERRLQMRKQWEDFFQSYDVALLPVCMLPALEHDHGPAGDRTVQVNGETRDYFEMITWMAPAGACYLPATVIPVGLTEAGLPVGIQIVGPYLNDNTTLAFARLLTEIVGPIPRPPGY